MTLIELLTVITIVAILLGIGVPSYRYVTNSNRVSAEVNGLLGDMQFARSEAVKEGQAVTVCPSQGGASCDATTHWENGWIVFSDVNASHQVDSPADVILRVQKGFTAAGDSFTSNDSLEFVMFNRAGFATGFPVPNGFATITLHTAPVSSQWTRCLQIFTTGLMATERTTDTQGNCT